MHLSEYLMNYLENKLSFSFQQTWNFHNREFGPQKFFWPAQTVRRPSVSDKIAKKQIKWTKAFFESTENFQTISEKKYQHDEKK